MAFHSDKKYKYFIKPPVTILNYKCAVDFITRGLDLGVLIMVPSLLVCNDTCWNQFSARPVIVLELLLW